MKNNRIYWNLRTGLAGGYFLAADSVPYFICIFQTALGEKCQIMNSSFDPISKTIKIEAAKRKIRKMMLDREV